MFLRSSTLCPTSKRESRLPVGGETFEKGKESITKFNTFLPVPQRIKTGGTKPNYENQGGEWPQDVVVIL